MSNWSNTCPDIPDDWKGNTKRKMNSTLNRKKLVYGRQATLDKWIETYKEKGYLLRRRITEYWKNGKVVYIAELEKETL